MSTPSDPWETHASWWRETFTNGADLEYELQILPLAVSHLGGLERVLDLGCGEGRFAAELQRAGAEVLAVDVAEEPLRRARSANPALELSLVAPEGGWELPDAGFDVVWAGEVIEHVADTAGWLSELRRVLRPRGTLLLSTPAHGRAELMRLALLARARQQQLDPRGDHLRFYTAAALRALVADFGFEQIEVDTLGSAFDGALRGGRTLLLSAVRSRF